MDKVLHMKPILLVISPLHLDYPLFRYNVKRFEKYFASIWIGLSNHHIGITYENFIRKELPFAHFVDIKHTGSDWRNDGVNEILDQIKTNEPIAFMEQDFLIKDDTFFEKVFKDNYRFLYFMEGDRIHPAFAVVKRDLIEASSRDFSAHPPETDHFGKFFSELTTGINIEELGVKNKEDFFHLNGLSQNYMSFRNADPLYQPEQFLYYNFKCIQLPVENHPQFIQTELMIKKKYGHPESHEFLDKFFPKDGDAL